MKIQQQKYEHDPNNGVYGDCYRTCVAMILDLDREEVPHFSRDADLDPDGPSATQRVRDWLEPKGLGLFTNIYPGHYAVSEIIDALQYQNAPNIPIMLIGKSGRHDTGHVVILYNNDIIDPSGSGIVGPQDGFYWAEVICVLDGRSFRTELPV